MARRRASRLVWLRRASQVSCLAAFLYLFWKTAEQGLNQPGSGIRIFFQIDPLAALASLTASHKLAPGLALALVTLCVTFLAGRWFCGWVCPLGTLHHAFSWMGRRAGAPSRGRLAKYYILAACLAAALAGVNLAGWLDPISFLYRSLAAAVYPQLSGGVLIGALFAAALALNFLTPRFWCRVLCPLGALLGVAGKNPLVRISRAPEACNGCQLCQGACQGGASPDVDWKPSECLYCFNCRADCPSSAIALAPASGWLRNFARPRRAERIDAGRRRVLASGAAGLSAAFFLHSNPLRAGRAFHPGLVRPPGSLAEADFLARCLRCGECMKACPTTAIQPAALDAGLEAVWTPVLDMSLGYCDYDCSLCSQACPSGAIRAIGVPEKQKIRIGTAFIDRNRCLPYAFGRPCIVCEEHCPTPKKAIWLEEVEVPTPAGRVTLKQPHVAPELCIGCGICVVKCVVKAPAAIQVASAGETRHPANGLLLEG